MAEETDTIELPELPEEYDALDAEIVLLECICEAIRDLFANNGFPGFPRGSEIVDADIGDDICCGRITISTDGYQRRRGPGWARDTMIVTIRMTREKETRCDPDFCKDGVHRCHISEQGRRLKRERFALRRQLERYIRNGCKACCRNPELIEVRKFQSGLCGGHVARIRIEC